jgi:hypothetical protein
VSIACFHCAVSSGQIFQKYSYFSAASRSRLRGIVSSSATSETMTLSPRLSPHLAANPSAARQAAALPSGQVGLFKEEACQMTALAPIFAYICPYLQLSGSIRVKVKDEAWNTHQWLASPRHLAIKPENTVLQHHCVRCGRDFVTDTSSNSSYAVFVSAISFDQLSDEVTERWLSEPCPGKRLSLDDEDRSKIIAALRVSDTPTAPASSRRSKHNRMTS